MSTFSKHVLLTLGNDKHMERILECMQAEYNLDVVFCGSAQEICLYCSTCTGQQEDGKACEMLNIKGNNAQSNISTVLYSLKEKKRGDEQREKDEHPCENVYDGCKVRVRAHSILDLLAEVTDLRDNTTGNHIARMSSYVSILANALKGVSSSDYRLSEGKAYEIVSTSKLHDLGKIAVPDSILQKPGRLTEDEFDIVKMHPEKGANLLATSATHLKEDNFLKVAKDIAMHHHEKWNGAGYPSGMRGQEIPLSARMVALADTYDALTHDRPYKPAFSHQYALNVINKDSGVHFDPYLVNLFNKYSHSFQKTATNM